MSSAAMCSGDVGLESQRQIKRHCGPAFGGGFRSFTCHHSRLALRARINFCKADEAE